MTLLLIAAAMAAAATHSETLTFRDRTIGIDYHAHVELHTSPTGAHVPSRGMERSCQWRAHLIVERHLGDGTPPRRLPIAKQARGIMQGACHPENPHMAQAARRALGDITLALRDVARQDSTAMLAEMEAAHPRSTQ